MRRFEFGTAGFARAPDLDPCGPWYYLYFDT
jgi:hypothetical protein